MTGLIAHLADEDDRDGFWRAVARAHALGIGWRDIRFHVGGRAMDLLAAAEAGPDAEREEAAGAVRRPVSRELAELVDCILLHCDPGRFALAARLVWRCREVPHTLSIQSDADVARARELEKSVRRDKHKMTAFVRFREVTEADGAQRFVAWFEPQHHIVRAIAPFFMRRFTGMRWSILTPRRSAHWDGERLSFSAGAERGDAPAGDPMEDVWRTYFASTFNPARVNVKAMQTHMPKKYWRNLPEASLIAPLVREAASRSTSMIAAPATEPRRPKSRAIVATAAVGCEGRTSEAGGLHPECTACGLHRFATQAVPGEGPEGARLMIVGEQPGDAEDIAGRPFVGPAGRVLDAALQRTGIDRAAVFVTNAVKHFKYEPRGKRRLHKSPSASEIDHCRWWLDDERRRVKPDLIVAMGRTAVRGLTGQSPKLAEVRSQLLPLDDSAHMLATVHPSYLLRLTDEADKRREWTAFLEDWRRAVAWLDTRSPRDDASAARAAVPP